MRILIYTLIGHLFFSICFFSAKANDSGSAMLSQYRDYLSLTDNELFVTAQTGEAEGNNELALTCYNIIETRINTNLADYKADLLARCLVNKGTLHYRMFNYREAMADLLKCLDVCEDNQLDSLSLYAFKTIGNIYSQYGDYERSSTFYRQGLKIAREQGINTERQHVLYNMAITQAESGHLAEADSCLMEFISLGEDVHPYSRFEEYMIRGVIAKNRNLSQQAIDIFRQAMEIAEESNTNIAYAGSARSCMARELAMQGQYAKALELFHQNETAALEQEQLDMLTVTYKELAGTYAMMGNQRKEMEYKSMYLDMNEKTFSMAAFNSLKSAQFLHDLERSEAAIEQLSHESLLQQKLLSQQRGIMLVIGLSLLVLAVMTTIVWRQKNHISAVYEDLFKRNLANLRQEKIYRRRLKEAEDALRKQPIQANTPLMIDEGLQEVPNIEGTLPSSIVLERILAIMERSEEYLQPSFSIDRMAQLTHIAPRQISKVVNEEYGMNFRSLLNEYRVKEAMNRLTDIDTYGHLTIKAISESVGYKSQSNFIAVFTRITGIKPSDYQRLLLKRQHDIKDNHTLIEDENEEK